MKTIKHALTIAAALGVAYLIWEGRAVLGLLFGFGFQALDYIRPKRTPRPASGGARRSSGGVTATAPSHERVEFDRPRRARRSGARR